MSSPVESTRSVQKLFITLILLLVSTSTLAAPCSPAQACDKCAKPSESSWNPSDTNVSAKLARFYDLNDWIDKAYLEKDVEKATQLANEYLTLSDMYRCNWNYGNAVHDANRILGLMALDRGDIENAKSYLAAASQSTGSPQLDTFGPNLDLAAALLKAGARESVKTYLQNIRLFWRMDNGVVDQWLTAIDRGDHVTLDRLSAFAPGPFAMALVYAMFAWPILVVATALLIKRNKLRSKVKFVLVSVVAGYAAMVLIELGLDPLMESIATNVDSWQRVTTIGYLFTLATMLAPIATTLLLARFFRHAQS